MEDKSIIYNDEEMAPKECNKHHTPPDNHSDSDGNENQQQNIVIDDDIEEEEDEDENDLDLAGMMIF